VLALQELATNALKHGALMDSRVRIDVSDGKYSIRETILNWSFNWVESGVELAKTSSLRRGFGRELLEHALPYRLDADQA
jgi:two-component system, chemotaxis family, CheB/CheR fusion protein